MDQAGAGHSESPCYTCRRRRVACDKTLPTCRKCHNSGKECLGYKKPLTWVRGIASRGKMMGLTFDDVIGRQPTRSPTGPAVDNSARPGDYKSYHSLDACTPRRVVVPQLPAEHSPGMPGSCHELHGTESLVKTNNPQAHPNWELQPHISHAQDHMLVENSLGIGIQSALVDPVFQGLDSLTRYYLSYYDTRFCRLMVLCEIPHQNPYRRLIPFACSSQALSSAISAAAACHYMHTCHYNDHRQVSRNTRFAPGSSQSVQSDIANSSDLKVREIYQHVLMFKHRALRGLSKSLSEPNKQWDDTIIASIVLLITLDMLESGQGDWKTHVQGAKELIKRRLGRSADGALDLDNEPLLLPTLNHNLDNFLIGTCVTIDIMGSTLAPSGTWSEPLYSQLMKSPVLLSQIEELMFIGCPAYLLCRILYTTSLRHARPSPGQSATDLPVITAPGPSSTTAIMPMTTSQAHLTSILAYIDAFDPQTWALSMQSRISPDSHSGKHVSSPSFSSAMPSILEQSFSSETFASLTHLASAYKIAITLYATRVLLHPPAYDENFATDVTALLTHLSCIPLSSELFKCTLWPLFIAGTECRDREQREWIQNALWNVWNEYLTVNVQVARRALEAMWERDASGQERIGDQGRNNDKGDWIQFLDQSNFRWLFI